MEEYGVFAVIPAQAGIHVSVANALYCQRLSPNFVAGMDSCLRRSDYIKRRGRVRLRRGDG
jgi:hypothetical protein